MADRSGRGKPSVYAEILEINTFAIVAIIDLALIVIIPNPLTLAEHLFVTVAAALIVVALIYRRHKRRAAVMKSSESSEEERNRYKPASNHPPKAGVAQPGGASDS